MIKTTTSAPDEQSIAQLMQTVDTRGPRYTSYPTVPVWNSLHDGHVFENALQAAAGRERPLAIYLHFPFCNQRCLYCGCNSYITHDAQRMQEYSAALIKEIEQTVAIAGAPLRHSILHLGGGTPTHTPLAEFTRILDRVLDLIPGITGAERSVEVDPRVTTREHLAVLTARGFNRISIGLQDVNSEVQHAIRREFPFADMKSFVQLSRDFGFTSINVDLIYGLPRQTRETWRETLASVLELAPDRLATFGYAHLPQRIRHQRAIHEEDLPTSRDRLGMLLEANTFFAAHGYDAVGMDHFARPADDLAIARRDGRLWRNFMGYTTARGLELVGFGCSAISEFESLFAQNVTPPETYVDRVMSGVSVLERGHVLSFRDRTVKEIINHLMCNLEVRLPANVSVVDEDFAAELERRMESLEDFVNDGLLTAVHDGYRVTPLGQHFVRNIAMRFDEYLPQQQGIVYSKTV